MMKIRYFNPGDKKNIIHLVKEGLDEFGFIFSPETSESDLHNIEKEYHTPGGAFLIMENNDNELIATGALKRITNDQYKIRKMYVSKQHRKKGFGKLMLEHLITVAKQKNAKTLILETSDKMVSAIALYKYYQFNPIDKKPVSSRCNITMIKYIHDDRMSET